MRAFYAWLEQEGRQLPGELHEMEEVACAYIESLWEDGSPRLYAGDVLSAMSHFVPRLKGHLTAAWRLHTAWGRSELPARAVPFRARVLLAMVARAVVHGWIGVAAGLAMAFHCLLRTGELTGACFSDLVLADDCSGGVLHLGETKGGKRRGEEEKVTICDPQVCMLLRLAGEGKGQHERIMGMSGPAFRNVFAILAKELGLAAEGYRPYSLRRGGATHWFQQTGSLDKTPVRGRWSSTKTARIYIDEATRELRRLKLELEAADKVEEHFRLYVSLFV